QRQATAGRPPHVVAVQVGEQHVGDVRGLDPQCAQRTGHPSGRGVAERAGTVPEVDEHGPTTSAQQETPAHDGQQSAVVEQPAVPLPPRRTDPGEGLVRAQAPLTVDDGVDAVATELHVRLLVDHEPDRLLSAPRDQAAARAAPRSVTADSTMTDASTPSGTTTATAPQGRNAAAPVTAPAR